MSQPTTRKYPVKQQVRTPTLLGEQLQAVVDARTAYLDLAIDLHRNYPELDTILSDAKAAIRAIRQQVREEGSR